jgi:hypothetical protein
MVLAAGPGATRPSNGKTGKPDGFVTIRFPIENGWATRLELATSDVIGSPKAHSTSIFNHRKPSSSVKSRQVFYHKKQFSNTPPMNPAEKMPMRTP